MAVLRVEACASVDDWPEGAPASSSDGWVGTVLVYDADTGEPRDHLLQENFEWVSLGLANTFLTSFGGPSSFLTHHGLYVFTFQDDGPMRNGESCVAVFVTAGGDRGQALAHVGVHGRPRNQPDF